MGNDTSANGKDPKLSLVVTGSDTMAGDGEEGGAAMMSMGRPGTFLASPSASSTTRRIVKATKPIPNTPTLEEQHVVNSSNGGGDKDDDDDNDNNHHNKGSSNKKKGSKKSKDSIPNEIAESPSVVREIEQEKIEMIKQDRKQSALEIQKAKRESILQQRRKGGGGGGGSSTPEPDQDGSNNNKATTSTTKTATATAKSLLRANPMSRFLSVFSVEPQHPEHKRSFEKSPDDDGTIVEPTEKKRRASDAALPLDEEDDDDDNVVDTSKSSSLTAKIVTASAAVAVVAVMVGIFLRVAAARRK